MIPSIDTFERQNYRDSKKVSGCQGFQGEGERWTDEAQGIFRVVKLLYETVMVDACHYEFVKTHRTVLHKEWTLM